MNERTIPAVALSAVLAAGLLASCSSSTGSSTSTAAPSAVATASSAPSQSPTTPSAASPTAAAAATSAAPAPVQQPSTLTLTATNGKASGTLVVAGTQQGVADVPVNLVFRPTGGGAVQTFSATTDASGAFAVTADGASAGTWTASFLGTDAAGSAAATATVG